MSCSNLTLHVLCSITIHTMMCVIISRKPYQTKQSMADLESKGQILRSTPNTAPLICGACNTQPEGLLTMA